MELTFDIIWQVASIQFSLVLIMMGMMLLEHVVACGWFGIGSMDSENGMNWIASSKLDEAPWIVITTLRNKGKDGLHEIFRVMTSWWYAKESFYKQYTASLILTWFGYIWTLNMLNDLQIFLQFVDVPWRTDFKKEESVVFRKLDSCKDF